MTFTNDYILFLSAVCTWIQTNKIALWYFLNGWFQATCVTEMVTKWWGHALVSVLCKNWCVRITQFQTAPSEERRRGRFLLFYDFMVRQISLRYWEVFCLTIFLHVCNPHMWSLYWLCDGLPSSASRMKIFQMVLKFCFYLSGSCSSEYVSPFI